MTDPNGAAKKWCAMDPINKNPSHVNAFFYQHHRSVMGYNHIEIPFSSQWEFQDPKLEVLYHISGHILWGYSRKHRPKK